MANNRFAFTSLTGGTAGALDDLIHTNISDGDVAIVSIKATAKHYEFIYDSSNNNTTNPEDTTADRIVVVPDSNTSGTGAWIQNIHQTTLWYDKDNKIFTGVATGVQATPAALQFLTSGAELAIEYNNNGNVELYYDNSKKFETVTGGATVTGLITSDTSASGTYDATTDFTVGSLVITDGVLTDATGISLAGPVTGTSTIDATTDFTVGSTVITDGVITDATGISLAGPVTGTSTIDATTDFTVGSTVITDGVITDATGFQITGGTITLSGSAETLAVFTDDGSCELYYDNTKKFETTSTGSAIRQTTASIYQNGGNEFVIDNSAIPGGTTSGFSGINFRAKYGAAGTQHYGFMQLSATGSGNDAHSMSIGTFNGSVYEAGLFLNGGGSAELYYDGTKTFETWKSATQGGAIFTSPDGAGLTYIFTDDSDITHIQNPVADMITATRGGAVELYHAGTKKFETSSVGVQVGLTAAPMYLSSDANWSLIRCSDSQSGLYFTNVSGTTMCYMYDAGAVELYYAGTKTFETTAAGISITDGTATAATIGFSSDDLVIDSNDLGGKILLKGQTTGNSPVDLADFNPDAGATLYFTGGAKVATTNTGATVTGTVVADGLTLGANEIITLGSEFIRGTATTLDFLAVGATEFMAKFTANGSCELYYDGSPTLSTIAGGFSMSSLSTAPMRFEASANDLYLTNGNAGREVYLRSRNTANTLDNVLFKGDPDGAAELYYAGVKHLYTAGAGAYIGDGTSFARIFYSAGVFLRNEQLGTPIVLDARNAGDTATNYLFYADPDGSAQLFNAGTLALFTNADGIKIQDTSGSDPTISFNSDAAARQGYIQFNGGNLIFFDDIADDNIITSATAGAVSLYHAGTKVFATEATGINFGATTQYGRLYHDGNHTTLYNSFHSGNIHLIGEQTDGTGVNLITADPDAEAALYFAGTRHAQTVSDGLLINIGALRLPEISTPTATADHGKVYTKTDNKLYFQDGAGTEHEIAFV